METINDNLSYSFNMAFTEMFETNVSELNTSDSLDSKDGGSGCPDMSWQSYMKLVCLPLFLTIGCLGNSTSFLVMCSPTYNRKSYSYYLRALAVTDTLHLLITFIRDMNEITYELGFLDDGFLHDLSPSMCKMLEFSRHVIALMSSWFIVCFTIDRFIAVCYPLYRARLCSEKAAMCSITALTIILMASQSYHLFYVSSLEGRSSSHNPCHAPVEQRLQYMAINYIEYQLILLAGLPFLILLVCNWLIVCHIEKMTDIRMTQARHDSRKAHLAIYTLYAVSLVFIFTLLPCALIAITQYIEFMVFNSFNLYCPLKTINAPFQMIRLVNYSCNVFLYGLTGRRFRREMRKLKLFRCATFRCSCSKNDSGIEGDVNIPLNNKSPYLNKHVQPDNRHV